MKVLMVDQFLPNSVYVVELFRELRKYAKITIFCKKNAGTDLDGVIWKDKLDAGGKGKMAAVWEYGKGLFRLQKEIKKGSYEIPAIFGMLAKKGEITEQMMYNTFNMGAGLVLAVAAEDASRAVAAISAAGETAFVIGECTAGNKGVELV